MGIIIGGNTLSGNFNNSGESQNTPSVVTDGLVLHLDAGINNSYINKISPITINKPKFCYRCYSTIEWKDYNGACSNNLTHKFISCNIL